MSLTSQSHNRSIHHVNRCIRLGIFSCKARGGKAAGSGLFRLLKFTRQVASSDSTAGMACARVTVGTRENYQKEIN